MMNNHPTTWVPTVMGTDSLSPIEVSPTEVELLEAEGWTVTWRPPARRRPMVDRDGSVLDVPWVPYR